jgi:hypothetical protein
MQARHRTYLELFILLGLCAAIALAMRGYHAPMFLGSVAAAVLLVVTAGVLIYALWQVSAARFTDVSLLTGALWDLIRSMEIRARNAASNRDVGRKDLLHHFAVDGAHKVAAGRPMPMGDTTGLDLTRLAFELMDRNDRDGSGHGNRVNSLRRGLFVFYAIVRLDRPELAYRAMCEHMKTQLRLKEDTGIDNFTDLKRLLGLPAEWPDDAGRIAALERQGLSLTRQVAISAVSRNKARIFRDVHYKPPGDTGPGFSTPDEILDLMRDYIR